MKNTPKTIIQRQYQEFMNTTYKNFSQEYHWQFEDEWTRIDLSNIFLCTIKTFKKMEITPKNTNY